MKKVEPLKPIARIAPEIPVSAIEIQPGTKYVVVIPPQTHPLAQNILEYEWRKRFGDNVIFFVGDDLSIYQIDAAKDEQPAATKDPAPH